MQEEHEISRGYIQQENSKRITEQLQTLSAEFLATLESTDLSTRFFILNEGQVTILDASGHEKKLFLNIIFAGRGFIDTSPSDLSRLLICLYDSQKKSEEHVTKYRSKGYRYDDAGMYCASYRIWELLYEREKKVLSVENEVKTGPQFRGLGIAQTLLHDGELIKDDLIISLAKIVPIKEATTLIYDQSYPELWTTNQVATMPSYVQVSDKLYIKRVTL